MARQRNIIKAEILAVKAKIADLEERWEELDAKPCAANSARQGALSLALGKLQSRLATLQNELGSKTLWPEPVQLELEL